MVEDEEYIALAESYSELLSEYDELIEEYDKLIAKCNNFVHCSVALLLGLALSGILYLGWVMLAEKLTLLSPSMVATVEEVSS